MKELEQTAVDAAATDVPPADDHTKHLPAPVRPQLQSFHLLTEKQKSVVLLLGLGKTTSQIAAELQISNGVVANHIAAIREKTGWSRLAMAVVGYQILGLQEKAR